MRLFNRCCGCTCALYSYRYVDSKRQLSKTTCRVVATWQMIRSCLRRGAPWSKPQRGGWGGASDHILTESTPTSSLHQDDPVKNRLLATQHSCPYIYLETRLMARHISGCPWPFDGNAGLHRPGPGLEWPHKKLKPQGKAGLYNLSLLLWTCSPAIKFLMDEERSPSCPSSYASWAISLERQPAAGASSPGTLVLAEAPSRRSIQASHRGICRRP